MRIGIFFIATSLPTRSFEYAGNSMTAHSVTLGIQTRDYFYHTRGERCNAITLVGNWSEHLSQDDARSERVHPSAVGENGRATERLPGLRGSRFLSQLLRDFVHFHLQPLQLSA